MRSARFKPESFPNQAAASGKLKDLQAILSLLMLRRVKSEVGLNIPGAEEMVVYTSLTELQKRYYKSLLLKHADDVLSNNSGALVRFRVVVACCSAQSTAAKTRETLSLRCAKPATIRTFSR